MKKWSTGEYEIKILVQIYELETDDLEERNDTLLINGTNTISKTFDFEITTSDNALAFLPFVESDVKREGTTSRPRS